MRHLCRIVLLGAGLVMTSGANAGLWSRLTALNPWSRKNRPHTLIVTGNFGKSRVLAELVQFKTGQPILLVSPDGSGQDSLYFLPKGTDAMALGTDEFVEFVDFLQPEQVVFLGDASYVSPSYIDALGDRFPVLIVKSQDWVQNARALGSIMKCRRLPRHYSRYLLQLEAASGGRAVPSGTTAESAVVEPMLDLRVLPPSPSGR